MSSTLYRLGRSMARAPGRVIGVWSAVIVILAGVAVGFGGQLSDEFEIPGTESQQGLDVLADRFPEFAGASGQMVFSTTDGSTVDEHQQQIQQTMEEAAQVDGVAAAPDPFADVSAGTRNDDDTAMMASVQMDGDLGEFPDSALDQLVSVAEVGATGALEVHVGGQIFTENPIPVSIAEVVGVMVALLVLAITFRAIVPAVIPIVTAVIGVGVSMTVVLILASVVEIPNVTPTLAIMLGLAVGIDYALFILFRHREQLRRGSEVADSIAQAVATSGSAVIFAGLAVVIALVGLFVTGIPFLTLMGLASAFTVALAVVIALTLLPALAGLLGERIRPRSVRRAMAAGGGHLPAPEPGPDAELEAEADIGPSIEGSRRRSVPPATRWVRLVTAVPMLTIVLVIVGVGVLAVPAKDLRLGLPDLGTQSEDTIGRQTYDVISREFGPGYNGPLLVTADIINTTDPLGVMDELEQRIAELPGVEEVQLSTPNPTADMGVVVVIPSGGQTDQSTEELVGTLRAERGQWEQELGISDVTVTGQTAAGIDITERLSDALLPFGVFVVGLSLILLTLVFRSLWVPLKASIGYLISVGAAFGVVAMVFEYGWGNAALNIGVVGPVISFMPIMVMGVLFGLAMDYEVFLVSRMREDYVHGTPAKQAVISGFTASAPVVVAAALIMISVFGSFVPATSYMIQPIALGLAVGVLVDAFVVRMTLVPAVLALLGDRAWHLPRWLERTLPRIDVEGEGLVGVLEHHRWMEQNGRAALRLQDAVLPLLDAPGRVGPLTGTVRPGNLLVVHSQDDSVRTALLAAVAGRSEPEDGVLAVHDRLSPVDIGALQARTHWIGAGEDVAARLTLIPERALDGHLIVIGELEDLIAAGDGTIGRLESMLEAGVTVLTGCDTDQPGPAERQLAAALEDPSRQIALRLRRAERTAPALEGAPS